MATLDKDDKIKADIDKTKNEEKNNGIKESKSKDRERGESKRSKKHKKRRSPSPSDSSDDSPSRSRSRSSRRKSHKKHKSKRSRSRSDRKSRKRSNSRSRSRKHRSHRSKSRSRDRNRKRSDSRDKRKAPEKPKEKSRGGGFKFDSPPKEMQIAEQSINFQELGIPNIEVLKEMYPALKNMDPSELLQKLQLISDMKNLQTSKVDRKLYIGNIPAGITPQMLMDLLNSALQKMNINIDPPGNSIIGAWISPDNHYAFVDFRTPEEATNGFALNSVAIHGQTLKVGRPRSYQQTQNVQNPLSALLGSAGLPLNPLGMLGQGEGTMTVTQKVQPPSRVLILKNMVQISELEIDEEYNEILEDVRDECQKYGKVLSIKIPRPQQGKTDIPGLGKIYVEYSTLDEAKEARKELHGRTFADSTVEVSYHDEERYAQNDLSD